MEAHVTPILSARPVAALLIIGVLGCAGCERSQPGPKPISGTASDRPAAGTAATPANPNSPSLPPASGPAR